MLRETDMNDPDPKPQLRVSRRDMTVRLTRVRVHCPACETYAEGAWYRTGKLVGGMQAYPGPPVLIQDESCKCGKVDSSEVFGIDAERA